jgi:hypothetical protein
MKTVRLWMAVAVAAIIGSGPPVLAQHSHAAIVPSESIEQVIDGGPIYHETIKVPAGPSLVLHCCEGLESGFFATGDLLWFRPRRRAFDFAILDPVDNGIPEGSLQSLDWERDLGARTMIGYRTETGWEWSATYTYFHSRDSRFLAAPDAGTLYTTLTHPSMIEESDFALASSSFDYDVVDIGIGRSIQLGDCFGVRLFTGARMAWIDQSFRAAYQGEDANQASVINPILFDGAGLRIGGETHWRLAGNLSLFGSAYGSLLLGDFRTRLRELNNNGGDLIVDVGDKYAQVVPVGELALGVAWHWRRLNAAVGYELSHWFGLSESLTFADDFHLGKAIHRPGDLSLEGLFFRMGFNY